MNGSDLTPADLKPRSVTLSHIDSLARLYLPLSFPKPIHSASPPGIVGGNPRQCHVSVEGSWMHTCGLAPVRVPFLYRRSRFREPHDTLRVLSLMRVKEMHWHTKHKAERRAPQPCLTWPQRQRLFNVVFPSLASTQRTPSEGFPDLLSQQIRRSQQY